MHASMAGPAGVCGARSAPPWTRARWRPGASGSPEATWETRPSCRTCRTCRGRSRRMGRSARLPRTVPATPAAATTPSPTAGHMPSSRPGATPSPGRRTASGRRAGTSPFVPPGASGGRSGGDGAAFTAAAGSRRRRIASSRPVRRSPPATPTGRLPSSEFALPSSTAAPPSTSPRHSPSPKTSPGKRGRPAFNPLAQQGPRGPGANVQELLVKYARNCPEKLKLCLAAQQPKYLPSGRCSFVPRANEPLSSAGPADGGPELWEPRFPRFPNRGDAT